MSFKDLVPYIVRAGFMVLAGVLHSTGLIDAAGVTALQAIAVAVPSHKS